eukprot:COSAG01_NODE_24207_length_786_cov_4.232897_1_plen_52_part_01
MCDEKRNAIRNKYLHNPGGFIAKHPKMYQMLLQAGLPRHVDVNPGAYKFKNW